MENLGIDVDEILGGLVLIIIFEQLVGPFFDDAFDRRGEFLSFLDRTAINPPFGFFERLEFFRQP